MILYSSSNTITTMLVRRRRQVLLDMWAMKNEASVTHMEETSVSRTIIHVQSTTACYCTQIVEHLML